MSTTKWHIGQTLKENERAIIEACMRFYEGNKTKVAASLGVSVRTIDNKLSLYKAMDERKDS